MGDVRTVLSDLSDGVEVNLLQKQLAEDVPLDSRKLGVEGL